MAKYIDAEAAFKVTRDISNHYHEMYVSNARAETAEWCLKKLKELPAADVVEVDTVKKMIKDTIRGFLTTEDGVITPIERTLLTVNKKLQKWLDSAKIDKDDENNEV